MYIWVMLQIYTKHEVHLLFSSSPHTGVAKIMWAHFLSQ